VCALASVAIFVDRLSVEKNLDLLNIWEPVCAVPLTANERVRCIRQHQYFRRATKRRTGAMACACPMVYSNIPAHREFLDDETAGYGAAQ
jgi:hypothetical protein